MLHKLAVHHFHYVHQLQFRNSVTTIGGSAFSSCFNLRILTLGSGIKEIGDSSFGNCYFLECIYYYGDQEPYLGENAFYNVTTTVITYSTYESTTFDLTKSFSYLLTITLSITHSFTYYEIQTKSLSLIIINSSNIYIETEYIYYDSTVIIYSTYYNYYSNFFTFIYSNEFQTNDNKTTIIIIIVCVIVIIIIIISLLIILLIRIKNKKEEIAENEFSEQQNDNNQTTNTFTTGISISNIEEDPFANDFKEDKFIVQM